MNTSTLSITPDPDPAPNALFLQREKTRQIENELQYVNTSYYHMSQYRNRIDIANHEDFYRRQRDLFFDSIHLQAELERSKQREKELEQLVVLVVEA